MSFQKYCITIAGLIALLFSCTKRVEEPEFGIINYTQIGGPYYQLHNIQFVDELNGVMHIDYQSLLKTTDGGVTWNLIFTTTQGQLTNFAYPQKDTIYAFTQPSSSADHDVHRSTDGGQTWTVVSQLADVVLPAFYNGKTGYAIAAIPPSNFEQLIRTNNAGASWTNVGTYSANTYKIGFLNYSFGYTLDGSWNFKQSTDAGITWTTTRTNVSNISRMTQDGVCYGYDDDAGIIKTTDFGASWGTVLPLSTSGSGYGDFDFYNQTVALIYNWNIIVSKDGGATWTTYVLNDEEHGNDNWNFEIYVVDNDHALLYGRIDTYSDNVLLRLEF